MKERSQKSLCNNKNVNGNVLDSMIVEKIKELDEDKSAFVEQLARSRSFFTGDRTEYEQQKMALQQDQTDIEKKINGLLDSLAEISDKETRNLITKRIEALSQQKKAVENRLQEVESLLNQHALTDSEFDLLRDMLAGFKHGIDDMPIEQKRAALKTVIRRVIWDGENAHVILFGVDDGEIEYPDILPALTGADEETDELQAFADVDYDDGEPIAPWGEDSK